MSSSIACANQTSTLSASATFVQQERWRDAEEVKDGKSFQVTEGVTRQISAKTFLLEAVELLRRL